jgi:hypothetical protein
MGASEGDITIRIMRCSAPKVEVISLLIMRLGYDCRNVGELLKLKQDAATEAALDQ